MVSGTRVPDVRNQAFQIPERGREHDRREEPMTPPQHSNAAGESGGIEEGAGESRSAEDLRNQHRHDGSSQGAHPVVRSSLNPWGSPAATSSGVSSSTGFFNWLLPTGDVVCDEQTLCMHGLPPDAAAPQFET